MKKLILLPAGATASITVLTSTLGKKLVLASMLIVGVPATGTTFYKAVMAAREQNLTNFKTEAERYAARSSAAVANDRSSQVNLAQIIILRQALVARCLETSAESVAGLVRAAVEPAIREDDAIFERFAPDAASADTRSQMQELQRLHGELLRVRGPRSI